MALINKVKMAGVSWGMSQDEESQAKLFIRNFTTEAQININKPYQFIP